MSGELREAFDEVVLGTSALEAFPFDDFANRLHNKVRACIGSENNRDAVQKYIERAPNYPPGDSDADSSYLDGFLAYDLLYRLSLPAASDGIASVDGSLDTDNLRRFVSSVSACFVNQTSWRERLLSVHTRITQSSATSSP